MGNLIDKRIVQARAYNDPNVLPIPDIDYYYTYPVSLFEAIKKTDASDSSNLNDEFDAIITRLMLKQNLIGANTNGAIITYTGQDGVTGIRPVVHSINSVAALRSNSNIPTEQAVGSLGDTKANSADLINHKSNKNVHMTSEEKLRWNMMTPLSVFQSHESDDNIHTSAAEKILWNNKTNNSDFILHVNNHNNPHVVTASQINTYTKPEIDDKLLSMQTKFFNYLNIVWDEQAGTVTLEKYNSTNWDPNYILTYDERLPEIDDPSHTYFALAPATDYLVDQTNDIIIYIKKPEMVWIEAGRQTLQPGDLVVRYPDTGMFLWIGGRFVEIITRNADEPGGGGGGEIPEPMPSYTVKGNNTDVDALPANVSYEDLLTKLLNMINPESIADLLKPYLNINSGASGDKDILGKRWVTSNFIDYNASMDDDPSSLITGNRTYYFKETWILYGHFSGIYYSTNGRYWMPTNISNEKINYCYEDNGVLYAVVVSDMNSEPTEIPNVGLIIYYSDDGINWNPFNIDGGYNIIYKNGLWLSGITPIRLPALLSSIDYNPNRVTGLGIRCSEDGINWTNSNISSGVLVECLYFNNIWIAVVEHLNSSQERTDATIYYSHDGLEWISTGLVQYNYSLYIYNINGVLVIYDINDSTCYSIDGSSWLFSDIKFNHIECTDTIWVATKYGAMYYSTDKGHTWNESIAVNIGSLSYENNLWVAVGNKIIYYSNDGITWIETDAVSGGQSHNYFSGIYYGGGTWISQGYRRLCYSQDGISWITSTTVVNESSSFYRLKYGGGLWHIITSTGVYYSPDGINWELTDLVSYQYGDLYYSNNIWIAKMNKSLFYSADGMHWEACNIMVGDISDITVNENNVWTVIVQDTVTGNETLCISNDGINWSSTGISSGLVNVYYNSDRWVVQSYSDTGKNVYYSTDSENWNELITMSFGPPSYYPANGMVISWGDNGIKYSTDGITFNKSNINVPVQFAWNENGIWGAISITMGENGPSVVTYSSINGIIWQSMPFANLPINILNSMMPGGSSGTYGYYSDGKYIKLDISPMIIQDEFNPPELNYYYSDDFINWTPIILFDNPYASFNFIYYANNLWIGNIDIPPENNELRYSLVCYSEDGINWIPSNIGTNEGDVIHDNINKFQYANGIWVASGNESLYHSDDGKIWQLSNVIYPPDLYEIEMGRFDVCYYINENNTWICWANIFIDGSNYPASSDYPKMYYSRDGKTWYYIDERSIEYPDKIISFETHNNVIVGCGTRSVSFSSGNEIYYRSSNQSVNQPV